MKSDREFIDGIYEKAARYREEHKEESVISFEQEKRIRRNHRLRAAAAAVFLIGIGITVSRLPLSGNRDSQDSGESSPQAEVMRMLPDGEEEQEAPAVAEYSAGPVDSEAENAVYVLTGEVSETSSGGELTQAVITGVYWIAPASGEALSQVRLLYPETDGSGCRIELTSGDEVLLYISMIQGEEDACNLENGFESVYFFWKEEGGGVYYKNCDGEVVDSRQLTEE